MSEPAIMATYELKLATRELLARLDPRPILEEAGNRKVTEMVLSLGREGEPASGSPPVSRHGAKGFAGRFTYEIHGIGGDLLLRYGNSSRQARQLYKGGRIDPVNAKALTIPIAPEAKGKRAKDFPGLFRLPNTPFLVTAKQRGRGAKAGRGQTTELTFLFVLKPYVVTDPHPWPLEWTPADDAALHASITKRLTLSQGAGA